MLKYQFLLEEIWGLVYPPTLQWPGSPLEDPPGSCTAKAKYFVETKLLG